MIDGGLGFQMVPWPPLLEGKFGHRVSGVTKEGGGVEWNFGRKRGLGILTFHLDPSSLEAATAMRR